MQPQYCGYWLGREKRIHFQQRLRKYMRQREYTKNTFNRELQHQTIQTANTDKHGKNILENKMFKHHRKAHLPNSVPRLNLSYTFRDYDGKLSLVFFHIVKMCVHAMLTDVQKVCCPKSIWLWVLIMMNSVCFEWLSGELLWSLPAQYNCMKKSQIVSLEKEHPTHCF